MQLFLGIVALDQSQGIDGIAINVHITAGDLGVY